MGKNFVSNDNATSLMTAIAGKVNELNGNTGIVEGESFALPYTYDGNALATHIFGMSIQDGTPDPSNPVDIVSSKADFRCVGKNLIPYPYYETTKTSGDLTFTDLGDGRVSLNGSTDNTNRWFQFANTSKPFTLKKGAYKFKCIVASGTFSGTCGIYLNSSQWEVWQYVGFGNELAITLTEDTVIRDAGIRINSATLTNCVIEPLLIFSSVTDDTYEPYHSTDITTDLTLRAIEVSSTDDYNLEKDGHYYIADTVDWDEDNGYVLTRRIDRLNITSLTIGQNAIYAYIPSTVVTDTNYVISRVNETSRPNAYSNYFEATNFAGLGDGKFYTNVTTKTIYACNTSMTSQDDWNTWLTNHTDLYFDFILVTPTTEPLTSEQAQSLLSMRTYDTATMITNTSDVPTEVVLEYGQSTTGTNALTGHNQAYIAQELEGLYGVKNIISYPYYETSKTYRGVVWTDNGDGTLMATRIDTGDGISNFKLTGSGFATGFKLKAGSYIINGCPEGGDDSKYRINVIKYTSSTELSVAKDYGNGCAFAVSSDDENNYTFCIYCDVARDYSPVNLIFKPMLRLASIQSDEYKQYAKSNQELTEDIYTKADWKSNGILGAKNLIPYPFYNTTITDHEVTFTVNDDGTIVANGTATGGDAVFGIVIGNVSLSAQGNLIIDTNDPLVLSGCPSGGSTNTYRIQYGLTDGTTYWAKTASDVGDGVIITPIDGFDKYYFVNIRAMVFNGVTANNLVFKPMLRLASDTDNTYQPYAKTNKQLTDDVTGINTILEDNEIQNVSGESFALVSTAEGSALATHIYGMSVQDGTPEPSNPVDIVSAKADFRCAGKNLIPYPNRVVRIDGNPKTYNNVKYTSSSDGTLTASGTADGGNANYYLTDWRDGNASLIKAGTYTLSGCPSGGSTTTYCLVLYCFQVGTTDGTEVSPAVHIFDEGNGATFTLTEDIWGRIYFRVANGKSAPSAPIKPMLRLASVADFTYEPGKYTDITTGLTLRAIEVTSSDPYNLVKDGHYYVADTVDWNEDNGYVLTRRIKHLDVESTTNTDKLFIDSSAKFFVYRLPSDASVSANYTFTNNWAKTKSNIFVESAISSSTELPAGKGGIIVDNNYCRIGLDSNMATTIEGVRTWLTNNPTYIEYALATPTIEPLTSKQAQSLLSLKTYDVSTSINATSEPEPEVDLKYAETPVTAKAMSGHNEALIAQELEELYGVKNLIPYPYISTTKTENGITWTDNGDGTVTASGTATANSTFSLSVRVRDDCVIQNGQYILSDGLAIPSMNTETQLGIQKNGSYVELAKTRAGEAVFTVNGDDTYTDKARLAITLLVRENTVLTTPITFKPMLRLATNTSNTYQPYAKTNKELTDDTLLLDTNKVDWESNGILGAKNLIPYPYDNGDTYLEDGITFTANSDGIISASGQKTQSRNPDYTVISTNKNFKLPVGNYIFSSCTDGSTSTYYGWMGFHNGSTYVGGIRSYDGDVPFTVTEEYSNYPICITFTISSTSSVSNAICKPMIRLAADSDSTYQPYTKTNKQLLDSDIDIYKFNGEMGAKNLIPRPYLNESKTQNGVTFTENTDGTITVSTVSGGATSDAWFNCRSRTEYGTDTACYLKNGTYILSGCPAGGSSATYNMWIGRGTTDLNTGWGTDVGFGVTFTNTDTTDYAITVQILIKSGTVITTPITFKPMLRLASDMDNTYQPYAMTNKQLTDEIQNGDIQSITSDSFALMDTSDGKAIARTIYGVSTQAAEPAPDAPVEIKNSKADFRCVGKNLIPFPYHYVNGYSSNGMTATYDKNGVITVNKVEGSATAYFTPYWSNTGKYFLNPNTRYTLRMELENSNNTSVFISNNGTDFTAIRNKSDGIYEDTFTTPSTLGTVWLGLYWLKTGTETNAKIKLSIRLADVTDLTYETYKCTDIATNIILRSIEVTSSDPYNFVKDGHYYICDTVDLTDNGYVITRRIKEIIIDNISTYNFTFNTTEHSISRNADVVFGSDMAFISDNNKLSYIRSNYLPTKERNNMVNNGVQGICISAGKNIIIQIDGMTSKDDYTNWFDGKTFTVMSVLATPTVEPITSEQAQSLLSMVTYDITTSINSIYEPSPIVELNYAKTPVTAKVMTAYNEAVITQELENLYGVKNLIPYPYYFGSLVVNRGLTFTANDDGSVSFSGTADNVNPSCANLTIHTITKLKAGSYILSGGNDLYGGMSIFLYDDDAALYNYTGNYTGLRTNSSNLVYVYTTLDGGVASADNLYGYDKVFTIDKDAYVDIQARSMTNTYASAVSGIIYPMLRIASITSNKYEEYAMTNKELTDNVHPGHYYGTCATAADTAKKEVIIPADQRFQLKIGSAISVKFANTNTASNPTLNVNGTGDISIYCNTAVITTGSLWAAGEANKVTTFVYDGTYWSWICHNVDNNSDTKVTQTVTTANANYEVLFSQTADNTTRTEAARKNNNLLFNPSTGQIKAKSSAINTPAFFEEYTATNPAAGDQVRILGASYKSADGSLTHTTAPVRVLGNNDSTTNNTGVCLGSLNGTTFVSAGESSLTFPKAQSIYNDENLYLTADSNVILYKGISNDGTTFTGPWTVAGMTQTATNGQVVIADGTNGGIKTSGYTIEKSVPSDAVFTDHRSTFYGTCTTAADTKDKVVTLADTTGWELRKGVVVGVKFSYTNTYNATTSNKITLNVNNTGAKSIYAANTSSPTGTNWVYFGGANRIHYYMYDGTYWVFMSHSVDLNDDNYRLRFGDALKAETAITASKVCVGTSAGYKMVGSGVTFDISYPVLYSGVAIDAGATGNQFWLSANNITISNIKTGLVGVPYSILYLVGSAFDGTTFTIDSVIFTFTPNVSGKFYIPIGIGISNTDRLDYNYVPVVFKYNGTKLIKITGDALTVNGHTVGKDVPSDAVFTDTKKVFYGTCTGQAANQKKAVTISSDQNFTLTTGAIIFVKFDANNTYTTTTDAPVQLNVNSSGDKTVYAAGSPTAITGTNTTFFGRANYINQYMYDGTYWVWTGSSTDNNNTYSTQGLGIGYGTCTTAAATAAKVATLSGYALVTNGTVAIKFTNAVPASATLNINSKGAKAIYYRGAAITAGVINAGDTATFFYNGTQYHLVSIDRPITTSVTSGSTSIVTSGAVYSYVDTMITQALTGSY